MAGNSICSFFKKNACVVRHFSFVFISNLTCVYQTIGLVVKPCCIAKRKLSDVCHAVGDCHACKPLTVGERPTSDACNAVFYNYTFYAITPRYRIVVIVRIHFAVTADSQRTFVVKRPSAVAGCTALFADF